MLPEETIAAVFPPSVGCGSARIGPATMAHIAALEALGIRYDRLTEETAPVAAWLLSLAPPRLAEVVHGDGSGAAMGCWMSRNGIGRGDALAAAAKCLDAAFAAYVPRANGEGKTEVRLRPRGYGWPVEVAEAMMSRYRMTFGEAMSEPLCRVFALMAAADAAEGNGGGPDYYERMQIADMRRMRVEALRRELDAAEGGAERRE